MKTLKKGSEVVRKRDMEAAKLVGSGWSYCSKGEWKKLGKKSEVVEEVVLEKVDKRTKKEKKMDKWAKKDKRLKKEEEGKEG